MGSQVTFKFSLAWHKINNIGPLISDRIINIIFTFLPLARIRV